MNADYYACYFDGACEPINPGGDLGIGAFILNPNREYILRISKYIPAVDLNLRTSNNVAEYLALLEIFNFLIKNNLQKERIYCGGDSKLVINQMEKKWNCNSGYYETYYKQALKMLPQFPNIHFYWIPREKNKIADDLCKKAMIENGVEFRIQPQEQKTQQNCQ